MSVKLDWDIESEKGKHKQHREDPTNRRARYGGFFRLVLSILIFLGIVSSIAYGVYWRWNQVNDRVEMLLTNTVEAEVAALRIGNFDEFFNLQRSASDDWYTEQQERFDDYQRLKLTSDLTLAGNVQSVVIDDQRARVQVQEIIDGVPYLQTWFYWNYADGWRHVPPDYEFWGEPATIQTDRFTIQYRQVDALVASNIETQLTRWLTIACTELDCNQLKPFTIEIVTNNVPVAAWSQDGSTLILRSPHRDRAREDLPFDAQYQQEVASLIIDRLLANNLTTVAPIMPATDADYLQSTVKAWLMGQFLQVNPQTHLVDSLRQNYGESIVRDIITNIQPNSRLSMLLPLTGTPTLAELSADWRDFVLWRLQTEDQLIAQSNEAVWRNLYDLRDAGVVAIAYDRFTSNNPPQDYRVLETYLTLTNQLLPQLQARVQIVRLNGTEEQIVLFNLVDGTWQRAS